MQWMVSLIGAARVMAILRNLFPTLRYPTRHGGPSRFVMAAMWNWLVISEHAGLWWGSSARSPW